MVTGTGSRSTGNGSRSLRVWHNQGGCHRPATQCTGRMGHGATRDNVNSSKMATRGVVAILAMVVPPTVSLNVPKALPGSHLASIQIWSQNSYWIKCYRNITKMFSIACIKIETDTPGIRS